MDQATRTAEPAPSGDDSPRSPGRGGRPRSTSRSDLERIGFQLFARQGFDETTVDDIAAAAGIGRRTFFRYFSSKNDLVWGDFEEHLAELRALLEAADRDASVMDALREAVVAFNRFDPAVVPWHRQRMELILSVPTLQADAAVRYTAWRTIVTDFVAERSGRAPDDLLPRLVGYTALAAAMTAYEHWLADDSQSLTLLIDSTFRRLAQGLIPDGPVPPGQESR
ncbi:mycofactocin system transcriptional regulator [Streptomyces sp. NPDC007264]|uniref:mycofactocin system transcriptional regulator n=1 Tax=Streptomyces sp. NPDC007264 TaxID=3364777 RepID=UPI0036D90550